MFSLHTSKGVRRIGPGEPCFIIAEMSGNHNQSFDTAVAIITAVAETGADAVKLQTYTADTLTIDCDKEWFVVKNKDNPELWKGQKLYDLYKRAYTPWEWFPDLKKLTESLGMVFFSTAYDETSVDFLEKLNVPCYKIASYELTDMVTLRAVARTGKPVILSTGFATEDEVAGAVETLRKNGAKDIALLHCITGYSDTPDFQSVNLATMQDMAERFGVVVGFSDNTAGIDVPVAAAALGACVIEKHVVLDHGTGGVDARFSVDPAELKAMVEQIRSGAMVSSNILDTVRGRVNYGCQNEMEKQNTFFRRSLFVVADMKAGDTFTPENIRSIRPSAGLPTRYVDEIIGKTASRDIPRGTPLSLDMAIPSSFKNSELQRLFDQVLQEQPQTADAIVWLQGDRLDRGPKVLELYRTGFAPIIFITGNNTLIGTGPRPGENDAHLGGLVRYLTENNVPKGAIFIDDTAMNTSDQAKHIVHMASERGWRRIILVTSPYHQVRAYLTLLKAQKDGGGEFEIVNQPALDRSWDSPPSGRDKTARDLLADEEQKIFSYGIVGGAV